jgi:hypothetical protein
VECCPTRAAVLLAILLIATVTRIFGSCRNNRNTVTMI